MSDLIEQAKSHCFKSHVSTGKCLVCNLSGEVERLTAELEVAVTNLVHKRSRIAELEATLFRRNERLLEWLACNHEYEKYIEELEAVLMTESEKCDLLSKEHYRDRIAELEAALKYYANPDAWTDHVIDSYSGECYFFDWPGDLGDEPYSIARQALGEDKNE